MLEIIGYIIFIIYFLYLIFKLVKSSKKIFNEKELTLILTSLGLFFVINGIINSFTGLIDSILVLIE